MTFGGVTALLVVGGLPVVADGGWGLGFVGWLGEGGLFGTFAFGLGGAAGGGRGGPC